MAASLRHGVVTRRQLLLLGLSSSAIGRRVERGVLHPLHRGVFAVGHPHLIRRGRLRAAIVAHGPTAVLSHHTAAAEHGLQAPRDRIDVTIPGRRAPIRRSEGVLLHLTRRLTVAEVVLLDGLPFVTVARALSGLAAGDAPRELQRAWNRADARQAIDVSAIDAQLGRGRRGSGELRVLNTRRSAPAATESELEDDFFDLCATFGLPTPVCQWPLGPELRHGRADFVFPDPGVAVEVDGRAWHAVQAAFELDRAKDLLLREAGYDPHRYTHRQIHEEAARVDAALHRALAAGTARATSR